jgi:ketosteroid isomerase-like protein
MNQDEQLLYELDQQWNEAYPNHDIKTLDKILAEDWIAIDGTGKIITKQALLERIASNTNRQESFQFDEFNLRIFGETAIITGRLLMSGQDEDGDFSFNQRFTRVYVHRKGDWKAVATQVTVIKE